MAAPRRRWTPSPARSPRSSGAAKSAFNSLNPGLVATEGNAAFRGPESGTFERTAVAQTPLGRVGQPTDIAAAAVFLASDDAGWLTGERLFASGGY